VFNHTKNKGDGLDLISACCICSTRVKTLFRLLLLYIAKKHAKQPQGEYGRGSVFFWHIAGPLVV
jgi:hypothetical protein